jgi:hypothetical protein
VDVLPGNDRDSVGALELVKQSEENTGIEVEETIGDAAVCGACALRAKCVASKKGKGRTVSLHPQEALLQQARALQHSEAFTEYRGRRQVSEHRLAWLVQLGIRQVRYFGRLKTLFQPLLAATVANLTLVATKMGMMRSRINREVASFFAAFADYIHS